MRWPSPAPLFTWKEVKVLPDAAWDVDRPLIVSDRLKRLLEQEGRDLATFYPVRLRGPRVGSVRQRYWFTHWRRVVRCVPDPTVSEIDPNEIPAESRIGLVSAENPWADGRVLLRDELKKELERARLVGIRFERAKLRSQPQDKVRRKNPATRRWEWIERRFVPEDHHFDANAFFKAGGHANGPGRIPNSTPFHDYVVAHSFRGTLRLSFVKRFLEAGGNPNVGRGPNVSPLVVALSPLTLRAVRLLQAHGADFNMQNSIGRTVLMSAAEQGDVDIVRALMRAGAKRGLKDCRGMTARDCVQEAVERGLLSNARGKRVLALLE